MQKQGFEFSRNKEENAYYNLSEYDLNSSPTRNLPSSDPFLKQVLRWSVRTCLKDDKCMSLEELSMLIGCKEENIKEVPCTFKNIEDYVSCFYYLLLIETRQIIYRMYTESEYAELVSQMKAFSFNQYILLSLRRTAESKISFSRDEIVVLFLKEKKVKNKQKDDTSEASSENKIFLGLDENLYNKNILALHKKLREIHANIENNIFGIVEQVQNDNITVRVLIETVCKTDVEAYNRMYNISNAINSLDTDWIILKLGSLVTLIREYQALMSVNNFIVKDIFLLSGNVEKPEKNKVDNNCDNSLTFETNSNQIRDTENFIASKLNEKLKKVYNESQYNSIIECLNTTGVTLIQGPPGTGKTSTIIAILSVALSASSDDLSLNKNKNKYELLTFSSEDKRKLSEQINPWLHTPCYTPWYDEVEYSLDDLEDSTCYLKASETDGIINISSHSIQGVFNRKRVLVCAPSNAAIDEIVKRLVTSCKEEGGIFDVHGNRFNPPIVRVGPNVHPDLIEYSLEYKTNLRLKKYASQFKMSKLDTFTIKNEIMNESWIVCATLSACGSVDIVSFPHPFDFVVVDEASQSVEISTLVPMRLGCKKFVLVGDPRQLPATVISTTAIRLKYDRSLFQRLQLAYHPVSLLSVQYRMHPNISLFPSSTFYNNQLKDACNIMDLISPIFQDSPIPIFKPLVFFNLNSKHMQASTSLVNHEEADFVCQIVEMLSIVLNCMPKIERSAPWQNRLAIITPYSQQVQLIRAKIKSLFCIPNNVSCLIDINTIDGFQGREKDIVIFSAVRSKCTEEECEEESDCDEKNKKKKRKMYVGKFLADERRMNVALTRARCNLFIVGNGNFLNRNKNWRYFFEFCVNNDNMFNVNLDRMSIKNYLKKWILGYFNRQPTCKNYLIKIAPEALEKIKENIKEFDENVFRHSIKEEDEQNQDLKNLYQKEKEFIEEYTIQDDDDDFDSIPTFVCEKELQNPLLEDNADND